MMNVQPDPYLGTEATIGALAGIAPDLLRDLLAIGTSRDGDAACIGSVLERIGLSCGAERVLVLTLHEPDWSCLHEWHGPDTPPVRGFLQSVPQTGLEGEIARLAACESVDSGPVAAMAPGALQRLMTALGIARFIAFPFTVSDSLNGALALTLPGGTPPPGPGDRRLLQILADGLGELERRQRTERELIAAREGQALTLARLRATLDALPEVHIEMDGEGRCVDVHAHDLTALTLPPERLIGTALEDALPAPVAALQRQAMAQARLTRMAETPPYALGPESRPRWFQATVVRLSGPASPAGTGAERFVFRIRDITDLRLREARERVLSQVVSQVPLGVVLFDAARHILWANPAFAEHVGQPVDRLVGAPIEQTLDAETTGAEMLHRLRQALDGRQVIEGTIWRRTATGLRALNALVSPCWTEDGRFVGFVGIERDITEARAAEAEAERLRHEAAAARTRLEAAIEALPDGFVIYDANARMTMWNRSFVQINAPIAALIRPGLSRVAFLAAARAAGMLPPGDGGLIEMLDQSRVERPVSIEQHLTDGRVLRITGRPMAGGGHVVLVSDITDMREAQNRLANVIDGARVATWDHDLASGRLTVNAHWTAMLGESPQTTDALTTASWLDRLHPQDAPRLRARLDGIAAGRADSLEEEYRLRHRDGRWIHVLTRGRVIGASAGPGGVPRLRGVDIDITDRRLAEERLQVIVDAAEVGTWQLDARSGEVLVDAAYARLLGRRLDELAPFSYARFRALVHPDDLAETDRRVIGAARTGSSEIRHEFRMRHADGSWRWILSRARILEWDSAGHPLRQSGVHLDITEARDRERALAQARDALAEALRARRQAEKRMTDLAAISDDWFWEQDVQGRYTWLSDGFMRATGSRPGWMIGRTRSELGLSGSPTVRHGWDDLDRWIAAREPIRDFIYLTRNGSDGTPIWVRINGAPFHDAEGRFAGYLGVGSNVTELMRATEQAEAANRAKSRFLATMSHELRTPMTAVLGLTELMQDRVADPELRDMLQTIRDSGAGLLSVLDDILDLAKIEAGKLDIDPEPLEPADLVRRCTALHGPRARAAGLTLDVTLGPDCGRLRLGDVNRTIQILNNLLGNAIKFTQSGGVRLTLDGDPADPERLRLVVEDDGIGMTDQQLSRVFGEFEQAEATTARRFGGTGLGLSITRRLVALMGGTVTLTSQPDHGTRVEVVLPMPRLSADTRAGIDDLGPDGQPPDAAGTGAGTGPGAALRPGPGTSPAATAGMAGAVAVLTEPGLAGVRALVADDNATNRRILAAMLSGLGVRFTLAEDGRAALEQYRPGAYDLLILDISMPGLDGPAALSAMREQDLAAGAPPPPALAVTAHAMSHQIAEFMDLGFDGHLPKPFSKATLAEAARRMLARGPGRSRRAPPDPRPAPPGRDPGGTGQSDMGATDAGDSVRTGGGPGQGTTGQGTTGQGATGQGTTGQGATGQGTTGQGARRQRATAPRTADSGPDAGTAAAPAAGQGPVTSGAHAAGAAPRAPGPADAKPPLPAPDSQPGPVPAGRPATLPDTPASRAPDRPRR